MHTWLVTLALENPHQGILLSLQGELSLGNRDFKKCVALSTTEAEYIVVMEACKEILWLKRFLYELGLVQGKYNLYCDSQSVIPLSKNSSFHSKSKHIDMRYHWILKMCLKKRKCTLRRFIPMRMALT